jgi:hypothetical protein
MGVGTLAGLQFAVEAGPGIAGKQGVPGVESLDREQVPGTAQALDVTQIMTWSHFTSPRDRTLRGRPCSVGASTATSIWIWVRLAGSGTTPDPTSPGEPPKTAGSAAIA